ncbi:hypothetical protein OB955_04465 [Halobacteria archaeon AArc-m2/3/4]|uniref:Uncharacterized protein n=1 Tax=Natronoglomus mannanivorans TaxID=2979990 RepID=A0AAP3E248_9EURY|nr:hypothetical protein [Halobacteria archaeon AArc-xg1-1]MCU4971990.1 hypothetical protein [Halobacteria archaeon AArc-m2/3/4]
MFGLSKFDLFVGGIWLVVGLLEIGQISGSSSSRSVGVFSVLIGCFVLAARAETAVEPLRIGGPDTIVSITMLAFGLVEIVRLGFAGGVIPICFGIGMLGLSLRTSGADDGFSTDR